MYKLNYNTVFCDYLSLTYHPDKSPLDELFGLLVSPDYGYTATTKNKRITLFSVPDDILKGTISFESRSNFHSVIFKGLALKSLRELGLFDNLLFPLGDYPYSITRADFAIDVAREYRLCKRSIKRKFPEQVCFNGRLIQKIEYRDTIFLGQPSGTVYIGSARQPVGLTVYDKRAQLSAVYGLDVKSVVTRYEVKLTKRVGVTLRDVCSPDAIFYGHTEVYGLKRPTGVPEWSQYGDELRPSLPKLEPKLPAQKLSDLIEYTPYMDHLVKVADDIGPNGRKYLLSLLRSAIERS